MDEMSASGFEGLFRASPVGMLITRTDDGRVVDVNGAFRRLFGWEKGEVAGSTTVELGLWPDPAERTTLVARARAAGSVTEMEVELAARSGEPRPVSLFAEVMELDGEEHLVSTVLDLSDLRDHERALRQRDRILEAVGFASERLLQVEPWEEGMQQVLARLGSATDVSRVYVFENSGGDGDTPLRASLRHEWTAGDVEPQIDHPELQRVPYLEGGFGRWRSYLERGEVVAGPVSEFPTSEQAFLEAQDIRSLAVVPVFAGDAWWGFMGYDETRRERDWSPPVLDALKAAANTIGTALHRLRTLGTLEEQRRVLTRMALYDPLTGLANRTLFRDRVEHSLERVDRESRTVGVLVLDLDRFKVVNDTLGHAAGDHLLGLVGHRLRTHLAGVDTVARLGGDEFAVLIDPMEPEDLAAVRERVGAAFREPFDLADTQVHVAASAGVTLGGEEGLLAADLLRFADIAMYRAKQEGEDGFHVFDPKTDSTETRRLHRENEIRRALEHDELRLHYQPIVSLADGSILGLEALVRWEHPSEGLLMPGVFLGIAEDSGLIGRVDRWVADRACGDLSRWRGDAAADDDLSVSVNVSGRRFREPELVPDLRRSLERTGLPPELLEIEITEGMAIQSAERIGVVRDLGVRLAVDDLGTGYASLEYLTRLDVDTLKVDRSFTERLGEDRRGAAVVEAAALIGSRLGLRVVAEGVESLDQGRVARALGCTAGQGYLYGRPMEPEAVPGYLSNRSNGCTG